MKKKIITVFIILFIMLIKIDVNAADICNDEVLKEEAKNVEISYEISIAGEDSALPPNYYFYDIFIHNITENIYFEVAGYNYYYKDGNQDKEIKVDDAFSTGGRNVNIDVYGAQGTVCANKLITSKKIYLSYYNRYSKYEECKMYQDYNICKVDTNTGNIDEEKFYELIEEIKEKESQEKKTLKEPVEEKSLFEQIGEFYKKNKVIITIVIVILIIVVLIVIRAVKKKQKNKIKIEI